MIITVLAIAFLLFIVLIVVFGYTAITRRERTLTQTTTEKCSICRKVFEKKQLVERQIGDYKMMYFCRTCVMSLSSDLGLKN